MVPSSAALVCFHRRLLSGAVKQQGHISGPVPDINRTVWGTKLFLTEVLASVPCGLYQFICHELKTYIDTTVCV